MVLENAFGKDEIKCLLCRPPVNASCTLNKLYVAQIKSLNTLDMHVYITCDQTMPFDSTLPSNSPLHYSTPPSSARAPSFAAPLQRFVQSVSARHTSQ